MDFRKQFAVATGSKVRLKDIDPDFTAGFTRARALRRMEKNLKRITELQEHLYAEGKHAFLTVLQGMDGSGKDGTIRKVFARSMNPQGCRVASFKAPSTIERSHDFLWRIHKEMPGRGEVTVFNRSHYEDVLVVRVNNLVPKNVWKKRYDLINAFEKEHTLEGTHIAKFFLHISKEEQLKRFRDRLMDVRKHWKISESDYTERPKWKDYRRAYEAALPKCSTPHARWYVIPSNHKWFRNLAISEITLADLKGLKIKAPKISVDMKEIAKKYHAEDKKGRITKKAHSLKPGK